MAFDPISTLGNLADDIINKIWPNPEDRAKADVLEAQAKVYEYVNTVVNPALAQLDVDKAEAAAPSLFVAGWRPAIGWVGAIGLAYAYLIQPAGTFIMAAIGHPVNLPHASLGELIPIIVGMLGLGGLRTVEKVSAGVDANAPDVGPQSSRTFKAPWSK